MLEPVAGIGQGPASADDASSSTTLRSAAVETATHSVTASNLISLKGMWETIARQAAETAGAMPGNLSNASMRSRVALEDLVVRNILNGLQSGEEIRPSETKGETRSEAVRTPLTGTYYEKI